MLYRSKRDDLAIALFWGIFLIAAGAAVAWAAVATVESVVKLAIGIVTGVGGILTAVVTHTFNRMRDREQDTFNRTRDREQEVFRRKQENYAQLVTMIAPYVRYPDKERDKLASAHLFSWVVASPEVVAKTRVFLDSETDKPKALSDLLLEMRHDLGMGQGQLSQLSLLGLFPPVEQEKPKSM